MIETVEDNERSVGSRREMLEDRVDDRDNKKQDADNEDSTAKRKMDTSSIDDQSFSSKQRTRRENRENEVIRKAEKDLNVLIPNDDAHSRDDNDFPKLDKKSAPQKERARSRE